MKSQAIPLNQEGIYLFRAPAKITAQLNRDLLIVLAAPSAKTCGVVFFPPQAAPRELIPLLDALWTKTTKEIQAKPNQIRLKMFGMSVVNESLRDLVIQWARQKRLEIGAEDLGKNVVRTLIIECETGRIGVTYAESFVPSHNWLDSGSAQTRKSTPITDQVLVMSSNPVNRQLCEQAVAETSGWHAITPENPFDWTMQTPDASFPARAIIIFEDLGTGKPVEKWLTQLAKNLPAVRILWVGPKPPRFAAKAKRLPTLKPQSPAGFKKALSSELTDLNKMGPLTGEVIPFPPPLKKKKIV